jgi:hypothetical protein
MPENLPVTSELAPSYLVIENRKQSFASEYEVNKTKASSSSSKLIDSSKLKHVSEEDIRTLLTFFPVSGSGEIKEKPKAPEKLPEEPTTTVSKAKPKGWGSSTSTEGHSLEESLKLLKLKPRVKLPPRPMVLTQPVKQPVIQEKKGTYDCSFL